MGPQSVPPGKGLKRENSETGGAPRADGSQRPSGSFYPADSPAGTNKTRRTSREEMR